MRGRLLVAQPGDGDLAQRAFARAFEGTRGGRMAAPTELGEIQSKLERDLFEVTATRIQKVRVEAGVPQRQDHLGRRPTWQPESWTRASG